MLALTDVITDGLNTLEVAVLDALARTLRPGFCPSREELSQAVGLGSRGYRINKLLEGLEERGYVALDAGRSRTITLLRTADGKRFSFNTIWVPLVGQIVAGAPLPAVGQAENPFADEAIELTRGLVRGHEQPFALRVHGNSMVDALVNDGDIVVLAQTTDIHNGDMVAALIMGTDGQEVTTLKHFYRENGHVRLQPANPEMPPLFFPPSRVTVQGKVILVIRQMG